MEAIDLYPSRRTGVRYLAKSLPKSHGENQSYAEINMLENKESEVIEPQQGIHWVEAVDAELPAEILTSSSRDKLNEKFLRERIRLGVRRWPDGCEVFIKVALRDTVGEVFDKAADVLGEPLLPRAPQVPLDSLRYRARDGKWSEPLAKLDQPLWLALAHGVTRHFGVEYKLVIKINARWGIAPSESATPRELLTSFGMNPNEFSLYTVDGTDPLPPDAPLALRRGDCFEAQKDGKYGSEIAVSRVIRGSQSIEDDIEVVNHSERIAELRTVGNQKYVEVRNLSVPSPPWGTGVADILVAVPTTYPTGGLDAFYLGLPFSHSSGSIPNQQQIITLDGRNWALISWHYHEGRPWNPLQDNLETHIQHCRGFLLTRGVRQ